MASKKNTKTPKLAGMGNSELHAAMFAKRLSSAAGKHDARPNRQRTRSNAKRAAIRNGGW